MERELVEAEREIIANRGQLKLSMLISGDALGVIQGNANLREMLMNLVDYLDVVLACRVSPK